MNVLESEAQNSKEHYKDMTEQYKNEVDRYQEKADSEIGKEHSFQLAKARGLFCRATLKP